MKAAGRDNETTSVPFKLHGSNLPWNIDKLVKYFVFNMLTLPRLLNCKQMVLQNGAIHTARENSLLLLVSRVQVSRCCSARFVRSAAVMHRAG
jgi:hypothetical protein